ncbi:hypothetical protein Tco_0462105 [Tanacetum coccineum]
MSCFISLNNGKDGSGGDTGGSCGEGDLDLIRGVDGKSDGGVEDGDDTDSGNGISCPGRRVIVEMVGRGQSSSAGSESESKSGK